MKIKPIYPRHLMHGECFPYKTSSWYVTSLESFSGARDVWYDSREVGMILASAREVGCLRVDLTPLEPKNQTEPTSLEPPQNQTEATSLEQQNQTIPTSLESQNHIISACLESQNHTISACLESQNHTISTPLESQNHTIFASLE